VSSLLSVMPQANSNMLTAASALMISMTSTLTQTIRRPNQTTLLVPLTIVVTAENARIEVRKSHHCDFTVSSQGTEKNQREQATVSYHILKIERLRCVYETVGWNDQRIVLQIKNSVSSQLCVGRMSTSQSTYSFLEFVIFAGHLNP
jgi:hypothetical protein